jgi:tetratricopeptide (TPR) repeat protein
MTSWRAFLVAALLIAHTAHAENRAKARDAYRSGLQHYDLTEYAEALNAFKEAYRNFEDPAILFNIGQCYRQLGDKEQATRFYRNYLNKVPNAANRDEVRELIARLDKMLSEERVSRAAPPLGVEPAPSKPEPEPAKPEPAPAPAPTATPVVVVAPPPPPPPVYKRWWLWTIVGVAAVGVGVGLGVGLQPRDPSPSMGAVQAN